MIILKEIRVVWRVIVSIAAAQVMGGIVGLVVAHHTTLFLNFWFGGAFAMAFGLIFGLVWHYNHPLRRNTEHREILAFFCFATLMLLVAACVLHNSL